MTTDATHIETIEVTQDTPAALRVGLACLGAFLAFIVVWELWRGVWPLSLAAPFFGLLIAAGVGIGLTLVAAAVFGPDERWQIAPGRLTVLRTLRRLRSRRDFSAADIHSIAIGVVEWDGVPDTYRLDVLTAAGQRLTSPHFLTRARAQEAMSMLSPAQGD